VFIADEITLETGFPAVRTQLAKLAGNGLIVAISRAAYSEGGQELLRAGRVRGLPGTLRLAEVRLGELVLVDDRARLPLHWEAMGAGGKRCPVLDADITLAGALAETAVLALAGAYWPPPSLAVTGLDQAAIRRCAACTTRAFLARLGCAVVHPAGQARPAHDR